MSNGFLPTIGTEIAVCATVMAYVGPVDADGLPFAYVVQFKNGRMSTISKTDTTEWYGLVIAE